MAPASNWYQAWFYSMLEVVAYSTTRLLLVTLYIQSSTFYSLEQKGKCFWHGKRKTRPFCTPHFAAQPDETGTRTRVTRALRRSVLRSNPSQQKKCMNYQLMNEAECLMKNYGHRGGCYPSRPLAEGDNTLRDLHNSSYDTKAELIIVLLFIQNNS